MSRPSTDYRRKKPQRKLSFELPEAVLARARRRRDELHFIKKLVPQRTVLLVIDMQNAYLRKGAPAYVANAADIVPNINRLAAALRGAGGTVVWILNTLGERADDWPPYKNFRRADLLDAMVTALTPGNPDHDLWAGVHFHSRDLKLQKTRYSAMIQGSSDLDARLRASGIDTVVITGTLTNVCCESTARDAMMLNYDVLVVADGTAAHSAEEHGASLGSIYAAFGDVMSTSEVVALLPESQTAANSARDSK